MTMVEEIPYTPAPGYAPIGGGTIDELTSTGMTVTITDPTGPITNLETVSGSGTISDITSSASTLTVTDGTGPTANIEIAAPVSIANGGTNAITAAAARTSLAVAPINSPTFTGTPAGPTAAAGTNTTELATTAFVLANTVLVANVVTYGADPTGSADSATAITNAIAALPATGGIVYFPAGNYKVDSQISIGNGSSGSQSTVSGIYLVGVAPPGNLNSMGLTNSGPSRIFAGASMASVVEIKGPLVGWGLQNLDIDGNGNVTDSTVKLVSAQWGDTANLLIRGAAGKIGLSSSSYVNVNSMHNSWRNVTIIPGTTNGSIGYKATGNGADTTSDTCYEYFTNISIPWSAAGGGVTITALDLQDVDNIRFDHVHLYGVGTPSGTNKALVLDYSGASGGIWPADCTFTDHDFGSASVTITNVGSPSGATPNRIITMSACNGQPANPNLANLQWGYSLPKNVPSQFVTPFPVTASGGAATVPSAYGIVDVTNNAASTLAITLSTTNAVDGQPLLVRYFDDTNAAQTLSWTNSEVGAATAPTTSRGSSTIPTTAAFIFNGNTTKWTCVGEG